jgi:S-(hydroxymethyl)glutathione dehydrogenase/alcohol dehydrogenase
LDENKLSFAKTFGATHFVNASKTDPIEAILQATNGGVDFAFDAIGVKKTNEQILPSVRAGGSGADNHGGMAVLIGIPNQMITIDPALFVRGQRTYRGSLGATYPEKDFNMFLKWHEEGKFPLDQLITKRYKLEEINTACADLQSGSILGRAIIEF